METERGLRVLASESAVYGVVLVSGLVVIAADTDYASSKVLIKIASTVLVFWAAHVYAGFVAYPHQRNAESDPTWTQALRTSLAHSWGMLVAALIPAVVLLLGVVGILDDVDAIWASLWVDVGLLTIIGYLGASTWSTKLWVRLLGGLSTAALGIVLIVMKALTH